jgi:PAS domain S-box-containing protein
VQYSAGQQDADAELIALAGRQTMLCQRLVKLSLSIEKDFLQRKIKPWRADTLQAVVKESRDIHYTLLHQGKTQNGSLIDSLLQINTPLLESTFHSVSILLKPFNVQFLNEAVATIDQNDQLLILTSQLILKSYQLKAEGKLADLKILQAVIGVIAFLGVISGLYLILRPSFKRLEGNNEKLSDMNEKLHASNRELRNTEEEVRGNLERIQTLQQHLESSEKQYQELVENTSDVIYELDQNGNFRYLNLNSEKIIEFGRSELIGKPYWKIIAKEFRDSVRVFYRQQVKARQEDSYYEIPVSTPSGKLIWLGQKAHITFNEAGWAIKGSVIARDITELKVAREKLEKNEKLYRLISTNSKDIRSAEQEDKILKSEPFSPTNLARTLKDSLDDYTDADHEIRINLARQMVKNILELEEKLDLTLQTNDITLFAGSTHKMITTFGILQNDKFSACAEEIKQLIILRNDLAEQLQVRIDLFRSQCSASIAELSEFYMDKN